MNIDRSYLELSYFFTLYLIEDENIAQNIVVSLMDRYELLEEEPTKELLLSDSYKFCKNRMNSETEGYKLKLRGSSYLYYHLKYRPRKISELLELDETAVFELIEVVRSQMGQTHQGKETYELN